MSVTETRRIELLEAAQQSMGRDVAITLMEMLPPSGWGDVATRQRVDSLERSMSLQFDAIETKYDARFDAVDMRFDSFAAEIRSDLRAGIAEMQASTTRWAVGTIVTMIGVGAAVAGVILQFG